MRKPYAAESFSVEGTRLFGGRWSPIGLRIACSSESRSLAALGVLVNARDPELLFAQPGTMISATIPKGVIECPKRVPDNWRATPYGAETQAFGANWARLGLHAALRVPSSFVLGEFTYLLNPAHPDFGRITIARPGSFDFDSRLHR